MAHCVKIGSTSQNYYMIEIIIEPRHLKTCFLHTCENKAADQLRGNRELVDQPLCFRYKDSTIPSFLIPKFPAISSHLLPLAISSHLLWMYSPVCVRPCRKTRRSVFLRRGSYDRNHMKPSNVEETDVILYDQDGHRVYIWQSELPWPRPWFIELAEEF